MNQNYDKSDKSEIESNIFDYKIKPEDYYYEIIDNENKIQIIIRSDKTLNAINTNTKPLKNIEKFKEITLIVDYESLSLELDTQELKKLIANIYSKINGKKTELNLIIQNSYINSEKKLAQINDKKNNTINLNKLEISDELYSFSGKLHYLFENVQANELTLKHFKFNSKSQLEHFTKFIICSNCQKLTLDDIFIELLIKEDKYDNEYNDLDIYFNYSGNSIILNDAYTNIESLTLRDCSLFAIIGNIFKKVDAINNGYINIDIDENSLLNPSIITKFKITYNKIQKHYEYHICFDLDSFKLKLENENEDSNYDYIDYLKYIFNIIISFESSDQKIKINEDDGVGEIDKNCLYSLTFKNFYTTEYEYITDDDITFIDKHNWVFYDMEEKQRKEKWEMFLNELKKFKFKALSNVKKLKFENCSNFFIEWILNFTTDTDKKCNSDNSNIQIQNNTKLRDFELLKIKKCAKDYINLDSILDLKIENLILFDAPLIKSKDLKEYKGSIDNLTIKINSLESYGKEYNLNTCNTYKILIQLIKYEKYEETYTTFEFNALSYIMTYLAYQEFLNNIDFYEKRYQNLNTREDSENPSQKDLEEEYDKYLKDSNKKGKSEKNLPIYIFFGSLEKRSFIYHKCFDLQLPDKKKSKIILKNILIKKNIENFEYLTKIKEEKDKKEDRREKDYKLKKLDFGSDGFYVDMDYKNFINKNKICPIQLKNVSFSNYNDSSLKDYDKETIINFIKEDEEKENENDKKEQVYRMDVKTLNSIIYKNFLFENVGTMVRYYLYKIDFKQANEKTKLISNYFRFLANFFQALIEKNKLVIIINNDKESKEVFCTFHIVDNLLNQSINDFDQSTKSKSYILLNDEYNKRIILPEKSWLEKEIGNYFLKEKRFEDDKLVYSSFNYYYTSEKEKQLKEQSSINILDKKIVFEKIKDVIKF